MERRKLKHYTGEERIPNKSTHKANPICKWNFVDNAVGDVVHLRVWKKVYTTAGNEIKAEKGKFLQSARAQ
jgi:hypothetical protein